MFLLLMSCLAFSICNILKQVARTKSTARPMTSEELVDVGVSPTREEIRDSESREDGEIRSENKSGGKENISNVDVDMNELVAVKAASHPQLLSSASQRLQPTLSKNTRMPDFSLSATDVPLLANKFLHLKPTKLLCFKTSSHVDSDSLVILCCLPFSRGFL
jgi:hypothetical protein